MRLGSSCVLQERSRGMLEWGPEGVSTIIFHFMHICKFQRTQTLKGKYMRLP